MLKTVIIGLTFAFTTPADDYAKDASIQVLGNFSTPAYCAQAHASVANAFEIVGQHELEGMRVTHSGACLEGDVNGSVSMHVEAIVSYPGIHLQVYNSAVAGPFTDEAQCEREMGKLNALVPAYIDTFVDLRASCYRFE